MEPTPSRQRHWSPALTAEYENLSHETDPEFRDQGLLALADHLEQAGRREEARDLYQDLAQSPVAAVQGRSRQRLGLATAFGERFEAWLERGSRSVSDPKFFLSLAAVGLLLRAGGLRFGAWALDAAAGLEKSWRMAAPLAPRFLALAGLGLTTACRSRTRSEPKLQGVSGWGRYERFELNGNDSVGEVIYFRQMHFFPGLGANEDREITEYQRHILRELEATRPRHVFLESFPGDYPPRSKFRPRPAPLELIRSVFLNGVPDELDTRQQKLLLEEGAGMVYGALHDEVHLHRTWTEEEAVENYRRLFDGTGREALEPGEAIKHLGWIVELEKNRPEVLTVREAMATREIMAFLAQNPGAKPVLIFGAGHEFADDFKRLDKPPSLRSVEWAPRQPGSSGF